MSPSRVMHRRPRAGVVSMGTMGVMRRWNVIRTAVLVGHVRLMVYWARPERLHPRRREVWLLIRVRLHLGLVKMVRGTGAVGMWRTEAMRPRLRPAKMAIVVQIFRVACHVIQWNDGRGAVSPLQGYLWIRLNWRIRQPRMDAKQ